MRFEKSRSYDDGWSPPRTDTPIPLVDGLRFIARPLSVWAEPKAHMRPFVWRAMCRMCEIALGQGGLVLIPLDGPKGPLYWITPTAAYHLDMIV